MESQWKSKLQSREMGLNKNKDWLDWPGAPFYVVSAERCPSALQGVMEGANSISSACPPAATWAGERDAAGI